MKKNILRWLGAVSQSDMEEFHKSIEYSHIRACDNQLEMMLLTPENSQWKSANALIIAIRRWASKEAKAAIQNDLQQILFAINGEGSYEPIPAFPTDEKIELLESKADLAQELRRAVGIIINIRKQLDKIKKGKQ